MAGMSPPPMHPVLEQSVSFLLGTWRGEGEGGFPTIQSFKYGEEIKLWHVGKPMMAYSQRTWKAASGEPMHAESGYFRPKPDGSIEAVIAQSTGLAEVQKGTYDLKKKTLELRSSLVGNASKGPNQAMGPKIYKFAKAHKIEAQAAGSSNKRGDVFRVLEEHRRRGRILLSEKKCHPELEMDFDEVVEITREFIVEGDELRYSVGMATMSHNLQPHLQAVLKKVPS